MIVLNHEPLPAHTARLAAAFTAHQGAFHALTENEAEEISLDIEGFLQEALRAWTEGGRPAPLWRLLPIKSVFNSGFVPAFAAKLAAAFVDNQELFREIPAREAAYIAKNMPDFIRRGINAWK